VSTSPHSFEERRAEKNGMEEIVAGIASIS
jgi:hypothetical protein